MIYIFIIDFPSIVYNNESPGQESKETKEKVLELKSQEYFKLVEWEGKVIDGMTESYQYKILKLEGFKGEIEQIKSDGIKKEKSLKDFNIAIVKEK